MIQHTLNLQESILIPVIVLAAETFSNKLHSLSVELYRTVLSNSTTMNGGKPNVSVQLFVIWKNVWKSEDNEQ